MFEPFIIEDTGYSFLIRKNKRGDDLGGQVMSTHRYGENCQTKESAFEGAQMDCKRLSERSDHNSSIPEPKEDGK